MLWLVANPLPIQLNHYHIRNPNLTQLPYLIHSLWEKRDFERRDHQQFREQAKSHILDLAAGSTAKL